MNRIHSVKNLHPDPVFTYNVLDEAGNFNKSIFEPKIEGDVIVHHPIPERLLKFMNRSRAEGLKFNMDKVAAVVLNHEENALIEAGLKEVIPHMPKDIVETPDVLLNKLEAFYRTHSHPKAKGMAKLVRGFKAKFL